jgi:RNA polymerase sigma factor (sigma-70 family)
MKVYLIDDDQAVVSALKLLLETVGMEVVAYTAPQAFLSQLPSLSQGCIVLDIRMPSISGLRLQERLGELGCEWPVIIITGHGDIDACRKAFKHGAVDFLSKPIDEQDLIDAVQKASVMLEKAQAESAERAEAADLLGRLTSREREVMALITKGLTSREIAETLGLSPRTVESHRAHIVAKMGTNSVVELARILSDGD